MFNFFANLAIAVYQGYWGYNGITYDNSAFVSQFIGYMKVVPIFGLFNNSTEAFYNTTTTNFNGVPALAFTIAVILSTICCIGVFWMIINAIRKVFSCFLEWF